MSGSLLPTISQSLTPEITRFSIFISRGGAAQGYHTAPARPGPAVAGYVKEPNARGFGERCREAKYYGKRED
jgi:hypothetical protein